MLITDGTLITFGQANAVITDGALLIKGEQHPGFPFGPPESGIHRLFPESELVGECPVRHQR